MNAGAEAHDVDVDLLTAAEVVRRTSLSLPTIRRRMAAREFPLPVVLSRDRHGRPLRIAWASDDVSAWILARVTEHRAALAAAQSADTAS